MVAGRVVDVVRGRRRVQPQELAGFPGDVVIGAGRVAAHAEGANHVAALVEGQPSPEHVHAAILSPTP